MENYWINNSILLILGVITLGHIWVFKGNVFTILFTYFLRNCNNWNVPLKNLVLFFLIFLITEKYYINVFLMVLNLTFLTRNRFDHWWIFILVTWKSNRSVCVLKELTTIKWNFENIGYQNITFAIDFNIFSDALLDTKGCTLTLRTPSINKLIKYTKRYTYVIYGE